ncbi:hypothetical protein AB0B88_16245 [Micromonospora haikouensis]|uniref:hypothetical protein n=1 Tax=Micromonospora haikouensis TaxID=686309 RepID=UPI0033DD8980
MAEQDGGFVAYRNRNTNHVHVYEGVAADLEARPNFERISLDEVDPEVLDEARRERAARESIAASADIKRVRTEVQGGEAARAAGAAATSTEAGATIASTVAPPAKRTGAGAPDGVLSRPGVDDVQIGPNPEQHPKGEAALRAQARLDSEIPANAGVLARQHAAGEPVSKEVPPEAREKGAELAEAAPNTGPQVHEPQPDNGDGDDTTGTAAETPAGGDDAAGKAASGDKSKAAPAKRTSAKATGAKPSGS